MAGRPTITMIARRAGVSVASVSRVLNGLGGGPQTVLRVERAARELGYVPNFVARSLRARRTGQVAVAVPDLRDPACAALVREIQASAREAGYRIVLLSTDGDATVELPLLRELAEHYVDGLVVLPTQLSAAHAAELRRADLPVVVIGPLPERFPADGGVDCVRCDPARGARLAVEHLHAAGCRRVAVIAAPAGTLDGEACRTGHRDALGELGLPADDRLVEAVEVQRAAGVRATERVLAGGDVDGIVCGSDMIGLGALHALREAGRAVPEDVAVVAMDDTDFAQIALPSLTSVSFGAEERGRTAAELLFARLADPTAAARQVDVPPRLVLRESSRTATLLKGLSGA